MTHIRQQANAATQPGQILKAEIIGVDTAERKIGLSFRGALRAEEMADAQGFTGGLARILGDGIFAEAGGAQGAGFLGFNFQRG